MRSRSYLLYLVLAVAALAIFWTWRSSQEQPNTPAGPESSTASNPAAGSPVSNQSAPVNAGGTSGTTAPMVGTAALMPRPIVSSSARPGSFPGLAEANPSLTQAAQIEVGRVRHMISDYHTLMGENPVGTNAEIMKQMMGANPHQATLGPPEGLPLNGQGELLDQWGTPYFFHQLSRDKMEVRSAGPDKVMWTADDVVAR